MIKYADSLFGLAYYEKEKKEKEGMTYYIDKEHGDRFVFFLENLNLIHIRDGKDQVTLTPDEVKAMYFKLKEYGWI